MHTEPTYQEPPARDRAFLERYTLTVRVTTMLWIGVTSITFSAQWAEWSVIANGILATYVNSFYLDRAGIVFSALVAGVIAGASMFIDRPVERDGHGGEYLRIAEGMIALIYGSAIGATTSFAMFWLSVGVFYVLGTGIVACVLTYLCIAGGMAVALAIVVPFMVNPLQPASMRARARPLHWRGFGILLCAACLAGLLFFPASWLGGAMA